MAGKAPPPPPTGLLFPLCRVLYDCPPIFGRQGMCDKCNSHTRAVKAFGAMRCVNPQCWERNGT